MAGTGVPFLNHNPVLCPPLSLVVTLFEEIDIPIWQHIIRCRLANAKIRRASASYINVEALSRHKNPPHLCLIHVESLSRHKNPQQFCLIVSPAGHKPVTVTII